MSPRHQTYVDSDNPQLHDLLTKIPAWTCAVDPGESVGILTTRDPRGRVKLREEWGWRYCPLTLPPEDAQDRFAKWALEGLTAGKTPLLRIEEYRIFPEKLRAHSGKTIPTAECIGAFKYIARRLGVEVIEQPASIKQTTASLMKVRGIAEIGATQHAKDAEYHMWYPVLKQAQKGRK
jgi:hypothetical protein